MNAERLEGMEIIDELGIYLGVHEGTANRRAWVVGSGDFSDILVVVRS